MRGTEAPVVEVKTGASAPRSNDLSSSATELSILFALEVAMERTSRISIDLNKDKSTIKTLSCYDLTHHRLLA